MKVNSKTPWNMEKVYLSMLRVANMISMKGNFNQTKELVEVLLLMAQIKMRRAMSVSGKTIRKMVQEWWLTRMVQVTMANLKMVTFMVEVLLKKMVAYIRGISKITRKMDKAQWLLKIKTYMKASGKITKLLELARWLTLMAHNTMANSPKAREVERESTNLTRTVNTMVFGIMIKEMD